MNDSTHQLCSLLNPPESFPGLLTNIKDVLESGLLLRTDFYDRNLITRVFGSKAVNLTEPVGEPLSGFTPGSLGDFTFMPRTVRSENGIEIGGISMHLDRIYADGSLTTGWIRISVYFSGAPLYEEIVSILGTPGTVGYNYSTTTPHGKIVLRTPTHRFANQAMNYETQRDGFGEIIYIDLDHDGRFSRSSFKSICDS